jgi:hypothetical protein
VTDSVHWWRCIACMRPAMTRSLLMLSIAAAAMPSIGAQSRPAPRDSVTVDSLGRDSLAARLARAEAAIALLRQQVAIEAQTTVRTRSRLQLELSARIMTHAFLTTGRVNTVDVPQLAVIDLASGPPGLATAGSRALGMSVRQSRLGAAVTVDSVLGGVFEGDVELDFFGGLSTGSGDRRLFPEPRLRTARARVRWSRTSLFVGSETPLISDLNPISVASSGVPGFVAAGNLWNWIPQLRLSRDVLVRASGVRVGVQGAVLAPVSGVQFVNESDAVDGAERSGRPYLQVVCTCDGVTARNRRVRQAMCCLAMAVVRSGSASIAAGSARRETRRASAARSVSTRGYGWESVWSFVARPIAASWSAALAVAQSARASDDRWRPRRSVRRCATWRAGCR